MEKLRPNCRRDVGHNYKRIHTAVDKNAPWKWKNSPDDKRDNESRQEEKETVEAS